MNRPGPRVDVEGYSDTAQQGWCHSGWVFLAWGWARVLYPGFWQKEESSQPGRTIGRTGGPGREPQPSSSAPQCPAAQSEKLSRPSAHCQRTLQRQGCPLLLFPGAGQRAPGDLCAPEVAAACSLTLPEWAHSSAPEMEPGSLPPAQERQMARPLTWSPSRGTGPRGSAGQARELLLPAVPGGQSPHMCRTRGSHRINTRAVGRGGGAGAPSSRGFNLEAWERDWAIWWGWPSTFIVPSTLGPDSQG